MACKDQSQGIASLNDMTYDASSEPSQSYFGSESASMPLLPSDRESNQSDSDVHDNRELWRFRLKYLFCRQPCAGSCRRISFTAGKCVYILLFISFLERLAYFGVIDNVLTHYLHSQHKVMSLANRALVQALVLNIFANFLYPIAGGLADSSIGRYKVIHGSLWLLLIGYSGIALLSAFGMSDGDPLEANHYRFILPLLLVVVCVGTAGFQANIIPYGADQIAYGSSEELSSYFYWYYWTRNIGSFSYYITVSSCSKVPDDLLATLVPGSIAAVSIAIGLSVLYIFKNWLHIYQEGANPWRKVLKVLYSVAKAHRPDQRSAFSYTGREPPSKFDLAKQVHGGKFSNEEVEDVKTFLRLLLVLLAIGGALMMYSGIISIISVQSKHMAHSYANVTFNSSVLGHCSLSDSLFWFVSALTILITLPVLNLLVYPCLREYTPSLLKRIGVGYVLALLCPLILLVVAHIGHHDANLPKDVSTHCLLANGTAAGVLNISSWILVLPLVLITMSEIFINVSSLEFLYAQSPHNMRGMMIGLFFFMKGLFSSFAALILFVFSDSARVTNLNIEHTGESCGFWYYLILCLSGLIAMILYLVISYCYKKRERGDLEETGHFYRQYDHSKQFLKSE